MTLAVRGRTLPANFGAYPATVEGVEGYVLSINGTAAFFPHAECDTIGQYLLYSREDVTEPVAIVQGTATDPSFRG